MELNKIYCMDCLEGMKQMEDNSVDLILTDPPYNASISKIMRVYPKLKDLDLKQ